MSALDPRKDPRLVDIAATQSKFSRVARAWAAAAGLELGDVQAQIALAVLTGEDPARAVPAALGIRKLCNSWRSKDLSISCLEINEEIDAEARRDEQIDDASGIADALAGGGTDGIARRGKITRRGAQKRVSKQLSRFVQCGDLFAGVVA